MPSTVREHASQRSTWLRLLYMLLYGLIFNILQVIIMLTVVVQFISKLLTGNTYGRLDRFGDSLGAYVHEIIRFLTFASETMPFPFGPWPPAAQVTRPQDRHGIDNIRPPADGESGRL
jgi:hypothetical protein